MKHRPYRGCRENRFTLVLGQTNEREYTGPHVRTRLLECWPLNSFLLKRTGETLIKSLAIEPSVSSTDTQGRALKDIWGGHCKLCIAFEAPDLPLSVRGNPLRGTNRYTLTTVHPSKNATIHHILLLASQWAPFA